MKIFRWSFGGYNVRNRTSQELTIDDLPLLSFNIKYSIIRIIENDIDSSSETASLLRSLVHDPDDERNMIIAMEIIKNL